MGSLVNTATVSIGRAGLLSGVHREGYVELLEAKDHPKGYRSRSLPFSRGATLLT